MPTEGLLQDAQQKAEESCRLLTGHGWGDAAPEELQSVVSDHLGLLALAGVGARGDHGGLQQDALKHHLHARRCCKQAGFAGSTDGHSVWPCCRHSLVSPYQRTRTVCYCVSITSPMA